MKKCKAATTRTLSHTHTHTRSRNDEINHKTAHGLSSANTFHTPINDIVIQNAR